MSDEETTLTGVAKHRSTRKKDEAPGGVFRHRSVFGPCGSPAPVGTFIRKEWAR